MRSWTVGVGAVGIFVAGVALALHTAKQSQAEQSADPPQAQAEGRAAAANGAGATAPAGQPAHGRAKDIRRLNQHFNEPGADIAPWMFVPRENIKELSTSE